jgi:hypothetical protein
MTPLEVVDKIKKITKINPFVDSRQQGVVEVRALLCHLLRNKLNMRWIAIRELFLKNGKKTDNATLMNAINRYEIYSKNNKDLKKIEKEFSFKSVPIDQITKAAIFEIKCRVLERKLRKCEKENQKNIGNHVLRN